MKCRILDKKRALITQTVVLYIISIIGEDNYTNFNDIMIMQNNEITYMAFNNFIY